MRRTGGRNPSIFYWSQMEKTGTLHCPIPPRSSNIRSEFHKAPDTATSDDLHQNRGRKLHRPIDSYNDVPGALAESNGTGRGKTMPWMRLPRRSTDGSERALRVLPRE